MDLPDLVSRKQLAQYLGMTEPALSMMASRGSGPPYLRLGRSIRYRRADVIAWLDQGIVEATIDDDDDWVCC